MEIEILVGIPGSGKSYYTKKLVQQGYIAINKDHIIQMCHIGNYDFKDELDPIYHAMFLQVLDIAIKRQCNIVVDDINHTKFRRKQILDIIPWHYNKSCICWTPNVETNIRNRLKEDRGYSRDRWKWVITEMAKEFERPSRKEGFDYIEFKNIVKA